MTPTYSVDTASTTDDEVGYTYTITNNGLLNLYGIEIVVDGLAANGISVTCGDVGGDSVVGEAPGSVTGLAAYPDKGLSPAASLTCMATDKVSQAQVRRGSAGDTCGTRRCTLGWTK